MSLIDKRKTERFALQIPAYLIFNREQGKEPEPVEHMTRDISSRGAFLHTNRSVPLGTEVNVNLVLPNRVRINVDGSVIRSTRDGIAVYFDHNYKIIPSKA